MDRLVGPWRMMRTMSRFDPATAEVPEMSPGDKSETSTKHKNAKVLVFRYLRVSLMRYVKSGVLI